MPSVIVIALRGPFDHEIRGQAESEFSGLADSVRAVPLEQRGLGETIQLLVDVDWASVRDNLIADSIVGGSVYLLGAARDFKQRVVRLLEMTNSLPAGRVMLRDRPGSIELSVSEATTEEPWTELMSVSKFRGALVWSPEDGGWVNDDRPRS